MRKLVLVPLTLIMLLIYSGCVGESSDEGPISLTLACWISDLEIQYLVETYNTSQSDYEIQIIDYYDGGINDDFESAYTQMQIQLISGEQPDLFYLDSMDLMSLINAGLLADIYAYMETDEDFNEDDYFMNIISLFEYDGALYELAPCFMIAALCGPKSVLGEREGITLEEFQSVEQSLEDSESLLAMNRNSMLSMMIQFSIKNYIDVINGTCHFDSEEFARWLEFVNDFPEESNYDVSVLQPCLLSGAGDFASNKSAFNEAPIYIGFPSDYAGGPCATALFSFGISTTTQHPEACWNFMKLLLAEEQQSSIISSLGFPVLRSALDSQIEESKSAVNYTALTIEDALYISNLINNISEVRFRYNDISNIIREEAVTYFAGDQTAEDAAALIQQRVSLYLAELG